MLETAVIHHDDRRDFHAFMVRREALRKQLSEAKTSEEIRAIADAMDALLEDLFK